jgi:hypothetical protein
MAKVKLAENWNVGYVRRDANTNDDILNISLNWENQTIEQVKNNLNTWLLASGIPLKVVDAAG